MNKAVFEADLDKHHPRIERWKISYHLRYPILVWQQRLRHLEALDLKRKNPLQNILFFSLKYKHLRDSVRLGFSIPLHTFGPGLSIAHWGTIAVDGKAKIGRNCRIHQGVTIGSSKGASPVIGDDCFIGANATVVGGIRLGNGVKIGANSFVNKSFPDGAVLVGTPAINISHEEYHENPVPLIPELQAG